VVFGIPLAIPYEVWRNILDSRRTEEAHAQRKFESEKLPCLVQPERTKQQADWTRCTESKSYSFLS
jgi:hypothetical protein